MGNMRTHLSILGAGNIALQERAEDDFYATPSFCAEMLMENEIFAPTIWECACGMGHLSEAFSRGGYDVISTDLVDRGYGTSGVDFLETTRLPKEDISIVTNPPYSLAKEFVLHSLELLHEGQKCAFFLKIQFLEGQSRWELFRDNPPKTVYVSIRRISCLRNGEGDKMASAICYCWFVWEKGFKGEPTIRWFNKGDGNEG